MFGPMTSDEAMELVTQLSVAVGILMLALILMYVRLGPPPSPSTPGKDETVLVGLAGGICSGKSSITAALREVTGVVVVDADVLGHEAYPLVQSQLVAVFGEGILMHAPDGEKSGAGGKVVNRKALGPLVFGNKANMVCYTFYNPPSTTAVLQSAPLPIQSTSPPSGLTLSTAPPRLFLPCTPRRSFRTSCGRRSAP